ncbi:MAG TPA: AAA family ATPase [Flavisolibacter sp.]|jgi:predicted kinase|nr:AAA family ATPase [Flavisolibacter sp.]
MQAVVFTGIQGSGKTTFYAERFLKTHLRISLDMLKTRNKERLFIQTCLATGQKFVVDNTNPTIAERKKYIEAAKEAAFKVVGYFFNAAVPEALERNRQRSGKELVSEIDIWAINKKLQPPTLAEGFDELYEVRIIENIFCIVQIVN